MRKYLSRLLFSVCLIGLLTLLVACDNTNSGHTTSTPDEAGKIHTSATQTNPSQNPVGTLSVMASGGLSGPYSFIDPVNMGTSQITPMSKAHRLTLGVRGRDGLLSLNITVLPYTGPGSYTLSNTYNTGTSQTIDITSGTKVWGGFIRQSPYWTCSLSIASDTPASISIAGSSISGYHEIKGKFSCSKILSALNTDAPINLTHGQLDLFVRAV